MNLTEKVLKDVINEASNGEILVKPTEELTPLKINFSTYINDEEIGVSSNTLVINDYNGLIEAMNKYFNLILTNNYKWTSIGLNNLDYLKENYNEENKYRYLHDNFVYLILNMTKDDLLNPIEFINRYISFLENDKLCMLGNEEIIISSDA